MSNLSKKGPATQLCITKCFFCFYMWGRGRQRERGLLFFFTGLEMAWSLDFDIGGQINLGCTVCFPKCPNINCVSWLCPCVSPESSMGAVCVSHGLPLAHKALFQVLEFMPYVSDGEKAHWQDRQWHSTGRKDDFYNELTKQRKIRDGLRETKGVRRDSISILNV